MGGSKVRQTTYIPGGTPQTQFNEAISRLMLGFVPALALQQAPELLPFITPTIQRGLATTTTQAEQIDVNRLGQDLLRQIRQRSEDISRPLRGAIGEARDILGYQQEQLRQQIERPMENPFLQSVIDAERRRLTETTRRGIEDLATGFQLAGMTTSSAMPEQARLLQERGLLQLQETAGKLLAEHYAQQIANRQRAIEQLSSLPTQFLNIGQIQSYIESLPYEVMRNVFTDLGQIFSMGQQGIVVGQVVTPSPFATVASALGGLFSGIGSIINRRQ